MTSRCRTAPLLLFLFATAACLVPHAEARAQKLKIGLVLAQENAQMYRNELDAQVIDVVSEAFLHSRRFTVVERHALDTVFQEKGLKGFIGDSDGADMGQTQGLDWIGLLSYAVERVPDDGGGFSEAYRLSVRMIEVSSARVLYTLDSVRERSKISENAREAGQKLFNDELEEQEMDRWSFADSVDAAGERLLENIRETFPFQGYVIRKLDDRKVLVDLGAEHGLRKGDLLEVFVHGEPTLHPVTGREIPGHEITRAVLKVLSPQTGLSTCKVKKSDGPFDVGAMVRFKSQDSFFGRMKDKLSFGR